MKDQLDIPADFIEAVRLLRKYQKEYLKTKDPIFLQNAKLLAMEVDKRLQKL